MESVNYRIRLATSDDIKQIAKLYIKSWRKTYKGLLRQEYLDGLTEEVVCRRWNEYIGLPRHGIFVAVSDDEGVSELLGFGAFKPYHRLDNCIYIESLHVDKSRRKQGIGTALIKQIYDMGKGENYGQMAVCLVKGNDTARNLYVGLGAVHYKDKVDDFTGEISYSEILTWEL